MADTDEGRVELRIMRFLGGGRATLSQASKPGAVVLERADARVVASLAVLSALARAGLVARGAGGVELTREGEAHLKRRSSAADGFQDQHREIEIRQLLDGEARRAVSVNLAESPLMLLARRKDRSGEAFLSDAEIRAGERLRIDFTRGQILPRLGANWVASVSSGRRSGGMAEMTDAALAARIRVEKALEAVGPELSGVLTDICCFLKGLETVESERGWPVRSAKMMLKAALGVLARHYEPPTPSAGRRSTFHWGSEGYRPQRRAPAG
ncbi:MAG: DUF6456 domain-containing protein [Rhizobiaceae bacterium]